MENLWRHLFQHLEKSTPSSHLASVGVRNPELLQQPSELHQRLILITDALLNIGFVICSVSSLQYVLQIPFPPGTLPDDL